MVWLAVIVCVVRALQRDQPRWWLAAGVVVGFGLYNYGEAGALTRFGARRLPQIYSGHNELWYYGPPPESATVTIGVGIGEPGELGEFFGACALAGRLDNGVGVDNEEQGQSIVVCRDPRLPWRALWPRLQHSD